MKGEEVEVDEAASLDVVGEEVAMSDGKLLFSVVVESFWGGKVGVSDVEDSNDPATVLLDAAGLVI